MTSPRESRVSESKIVVVSSDRMFADRIVARCGENRLSAVAALSEAWLSSGTAQSPLVIVAEQHPIACDALLTRCEALRVSTIAVLGSETQSQRASVVASTFSRAIVLVAGQDEGWLYLLTAIAREVLARVQADHRAKCAETAKVSGAADIALGRYVMDSMHSFNNALTAVVGNAELLMLDSADLATNRQEQIEAVHSNALRLHEMMQRFASLQAEMQVGRKDPRGAAPALAQAYHSGS